MPRSWCLCGLVVASRLCTAQAVPQVVGNIRIEALSPTLVRIEFKGPEGFEDRPTFHVAERLWPGAPLSRSESAGVVTLDSGAWKVIVPTSAKDLSAVRVVDEAGHDLATSIENSSSSEWLPDPGSTFSSWAFKDSPRIVPSKFGATAADAKGPYAATSGWDLGNDAADVYVFLPNSNYHRLRADFLKLTGPVEMPPLFMFGLIDSRWYPYDEKGALARIDEYRKRQIPLDVLVLDTDWRIGGSSGYAPELKLMPDLNRYFLLAHAKHVKTMFNDHPEPRAEGALDPVEMNFRTNGLSDILDEGLDVWWYDRNWFTGLHEPLPGLRKEAWGMRIYHDVTLRERPASRPVIMANVDGIDNGFLNHAPDAATHRFPVQWTGDTSPTWDTLQRAVHNALIEGVQGVNPYVHEDLGGHTGMPTPDLYARFAEYGSLGPIMRFHCTRPLDHAPWVFGPEAERIATEYIRLRYRLLPLIYADAHNATATGEPLVRRLDLQYQGSKDAQRDDQFLVGHDLLVAPVVADSQTVTLSPSLFHTPDGQPGIKAEYFANATLQGEPTLVRVDPSIDFNWSKVSPDPKIPRENFSARWTGKIGPMPAGEPMFLAATADDGERVWVDGNLVIDRWRPQDAVRTISDFALQPGSTHDIKVEYFQATRDALIKLEARGGRALAGRRSVWIPEGEWTDLWTGKKLEGPATIQVAAPLDQMPMYLRSGAILPIAPAMQYTGERDWSSLTLEVLPSAKVSEFTLYEDDGKSNEYRKGAYRTTKIYARIADGKIRFSISPAVGDYEGACAERAWRLRFHLPAGIDASKVDFGGPKGTSRVIPAGTARAPLTGDGPAPGGDILEVEMPAAPVSTARSCQIG